MMTSHLVVAAIATVGLSAMTLVNRRRGPRALTFGMGALALSAAADLVTAYTGVAAAALVALTLAVAGVLILLVWIIRYPARTRASR
jgi:uncharacterized membrane protein